MKPKYRRIAKFLPALVTIALTASSPAALFFVDTAGNGEPSSTNNGDTTIIADGGSGPQDPTPTVTINSDINMTGDAVRDAVIEVSGPNAYTINIAAGAILAGTVPDGILVFDPPGATTVNNSGTVSGTDDGIDFDGDFGVVNNLAGGTITGGNTGIEADDDLTVVNDGDISGTTGDGINANDRANITNNEGATISGGDDGVDINDDGTINNNGSITGSNDGIDIDDNGVVNNNTNFDPNFPFGPISGGIISGDDDGIQAGDFLTVNNQNLASISGTTDDGIDAGDFATITNFSGATISGGDHGIEAEDDLILDNQLGGTISGGDNGVDANDFADITNGGSITGVNNGIFAGNLADITNSGTVTGTNADGVRVGDDSVVTNTGTITGDTGIDAFTFGTFTLNNSGTITATGIANEAIDGALGEDTINLTPGSVINGDIILKGGNDDIVMTSDAFASNVVNGNINGGFGTDTLTFDGGRTSPFSTENIVHGDVTFMQDIIKNGGGVAFIGDGIGDPLFFVQTDAININGGGLYINADIDGALVPQTQINANGAALGGTGTWDANILITAGGFSSGAIPINLDSDPTNAVGGVTLTGDVTHDNTFNQTFIRFDVIPQGGGSDLITQNGVGNTYDLGNGTNIRISSTDNNRVISDGVYTVVDSDELILGSLGQVSIQYNDNVNNADTGFQGSEIFNGTDVTTTVLTNFFTTAAINGTDVELTVEHDYENLPGFSNNQSSIGAALDASTNSPDPVIQDFIAALDNSSLEFVDGVLTDLTSLDSFSTAAAITSSNHHLNRVVQDHLAVTRSQVGTISRTYVGTYSESAPAPAPEPTPALGNNFNVWGSFSYDWKDSTGFATDIDGEEASFLAGIDYRIAPNFLLGILLQGSTADYDFSGGGSDVDSFRAAIYGTYGEATGFYADFLVGYGDHDFDSKRTGFLGAFDTDTDAESLQAMLTVGYAMQSGSVKHGPWGGVEYSQVDVDGYTQGGLLPILIDDYDVESTRLLIGYRAEAEFGRFTPYISVAYAHELDDDNHSATGTLPGGATFGIEGGELDSAVLISAGTGYAITENLGLNLGYHGEISTGDGIDSHGGIIGLNYAF